MFDKARNHLISCAFRKANITSLESDPTPAEIEDAAHTLNAMLQSWNNDGFRLFKLKTGYMPFIPFKNEYSLATEAYKSFSHTDILHVDVVGATILSPASVSNMAKGQKIIVVNNFVSPDNIVEEIGFVAATVKLQKPLEVGVEEGDSVFYGNFSTAKTEKQQFNASFDTLSYSEFSVMPVVGNTVYVAYNNNWVKKTIISVDATNMTFTVDSAFSGGNITSEIIVYGSEVYRTELQKDEPLKYRLVQVKSLDFAPTYVSILGDEKSHAIYEVESADLVNKQVLLKEAVSEEILRKLGKQFIPADTLYPTAVEMRWSDFSNLTTVQELDWGQVSDSTDLQTDDWGYVNDAASVLLDWGTLTGSIEQIGFSKSAGVKYSLLKNMDDDELFLFYDNGSGWQQIDISSFNLSTAGLYTALGKTILYSPDFGALIVSETALTPLSVGFGVEKIIQYKDEWYLVSVADENNNRSIAKTTDFDTITFFDYTVLPSVENPAEFKERLFIGKTDTFVGDMRSFYNIDVYSQSRCVIGDRLMNLNTSRNCSYTLDGINFFPMPLVLSNQSAWGYKDGCSFIAIYGIVKNGVVGTEVFTANEFNPVWTPQTFVEGKVFDVFFDDNKAYFVSDVMAMSLDYRQVIKATEEVKALCFGEMIGRPQELMNVVKYGFSNQVQLPMSAVALKDYSVLPHEGLGGEPVNYCFLREAEDGKMFVWGTPNKFGEYLKFTYVEPLTLLEDARSTPDFPDEYYEAVEDGLASQLAAQYGAPLERQQALAARAQESKENALLHDNEDTSYDVSPNQRWL